MTARQLAKTLCLDPLAQQGDDRAVLAGCVCDLLSWVLANGAPGSAWVTVQTHMSVIAIAVQRDFACVIVPCGVQVPPEVVQRARMEALPLYASDLTEFALCARMVMAGIR